MAAKRPAGAEMGGAPPAKKPSLAMSPLDTGPATGEDDLNIKILQVILPLTIVVYHRVIHGTSELTLYAIIGAKQQAQ